MTEPTKEPDFDVPFEVKHNVLHRHVFLLRMRRDGRLELHYQEIDRQGNPTSTARALLHDEDLRRMAAVILAQPPAGDPVTPATDPLFVLQQQVDRHAMEGVQIRELATQIVSVSLGMRSANLPGCLLANIRQLRDTVDGLVDLIENISDIDDGERASTVEDARDLHAATAHLIAGDHPPTAADRELAQAVNFGRLYGRSSKPSA